MANGNEVGRLEWQLSNGNSNGNEWSKVVAKGEIADEIEKKVRETQAKLVVMVTKGHDGFLDMLRGSTTERVLRNIRCPLLAVPLVGN